MLFEVIKAVAKAKDDLPEIAKHNLGKTSTKISLINPILRSLGWDVSDWKRVTPEFQVEGRLKHKVDYALIDTNGTPRAFVEVNRLRNALSDDAQLHSYVGAYLGSKGLRAAKELACIVFTNGREWRFYPINAQKGRQHYDGWYRTVDLAKEDTKQCANSLSLLLSESSICNGSTKLLLTAEFRQQLITQEWQRVITQPDETLVNRVRKQLKLKGYVISKAEIAKAIRHPMPAPAPIPPPTPPPASKPRLQVAVGREEFDSAHFPYVNRMLPKVLRAIMELKAISGHRLVQTCLEAKITGVHSRAWVISAAMLAELRNSPKQGARDSAYSSKAIEGHADYFVLTNISTAEHAKKLQKLGLALELGDALKVGFIQGS